MKAMGMAVAGAILGLAFVPGAAAQFGRKAPPIHGIWNPVVGSGAVYEMQEKGGQEHEMRFAIVGSEPVEGKTGYWLEMASTGGGGTHFVIKQLLVLEGESTHIARVIMQHDDEAPMEMPMMMQPGRTDNPSDVRQTSELVGTEDVTTPAGTFTCRHYRMKDGSGDAWVSAKVPPWGVVKSEGREFRMTLMRVVTNAKSEIHGTPRRFNPSEMMHAPPGE
jgi:hypothetical protein